MQTFSKVVAVGENVQIQSSPRMEFFEAVRAPGALTVVFSGGGTCIVRQGDVLKFGVSEDQINGCTFTSDTAGDVELRFGLGRSVSLPNSTASLPVPLPVEGEFANGSQVATAALPAPVVVGMEKDNGDGTSTIYPLQTYDQSGLLTGHLDTVFGFVVNAPATYSVPDKATARITVNITDAANVLTFLDQFGDPIGYYTAAGVFVGTGILPVGAVGSYYVPLVAVTALTFDSAGGNTWGLKVGLSPIPFRPA